MMRHFTFLLGLILFLSAGNSLAEAVGCKSHKYYEKDYQQAWCAASGGTTEYVLPDKARVDCVTNTHAIEFDFAKKWAESIGQALYYGKKLNKRPGIVLIVENGVKDEKYINRVKTVAQDSNISLWLMTPEDMLSDKKSAP